MVVACVPRGTQWAIQSAGSCGWPGSFDRSRLVAIAAINELMALLTPARWGYEDIELPLRLSEGRLGVGIALGNGSEAARAGVAPEHGGAQPVHDLFVPVCAPCG